MRFHIEYRDAGGQDYDVLPIHLVDYEEQVGPLSGDSITGSYRLAHIATETDLPFRDWLRSTRSIEVTGVEVTNDGDVEAGEPVPTSTP